MSDKREQKESEIPSAERETNVGRNVPNLRFPGFSGEWASSSLGEKGNPYNGLSGKNATDFGKGSQYITYKSIFDNSRVDVRRNGLVTITDRERERGAQNQVRKGDIFFTVSSETPDEVGMSSVLLDDVDDCYLNSFCFGYRLSDNDVSPEFLRFYLRSPKIRRRIAILAQGSTRFNISKDEIMNMPIRLPLVKEQEKLAEFLNLIEERIAVQNEVIKKYESLIKALAYETIGNYTPNTLLSECVRCSSSTLKESDLAEEGAVPAYGAAGISGFTDAALVKGDSILITKDGSGVGTLRYVYGPHSFVGTLNSMTPRDGFYLPYIYYALQNVCFESYRSGQAIPHIYFKDYGKETLYCPSFNDQKRLANGLEMIDSKVGIERATLQYLQSVKAYLLSAMVI